MFDRANIAYRYDGSFEGFLTCIFEAFEKHEEPVSISSEDMAQELLFPIRYIETDEKKASRVAESIPKKISGEAKDWVQCAFLSCAEDKEIALLRFLQKGYKAGEKTTKLTTDEDVHKLFKIVRFYQNEAHFSLEFLRFSEYGEFLAAEITPKNHVLPRIVAHFCDRFPSENFVIYDKRRHCAFMHKNTGETTFLNDTEIAFPEADENETYYRSLWKHFYTTIAIEERKNHKLRRNLMPMRYWENMTEFKHENSEKKLPPKNKRELSSGETDGETGGEIDTKMKLLAEPLTSKEEIMKA